MKDKNRSRARSLLAAGVILAAAATIAACGGGVDTADVEGDFEEFVGSTLEAAGAADLTVESASCPEEIADEVGTTFECTAELSDGDTATASGEITESTSDEVRIEWDTNTFQFGSNEEALEEGGGGN